jgi:hypothetical protein
VKPATPTPNRRPGDLLSAPFWWLILHSPAGGGHAPGVLRVWIWWERLYLWRHHVRPLGDRGVLGVEVRRHRGMTIRLADGTEVRSGDGVVELHLANRRVAPDAGSEGWSPFRVIQSVRGDVDILARLVAAGTLGPIRSVHAVSLIAPALARLGFEVTPLEPSLGARLLHFYLVGLLAVYHPEGWRAAERARTRSWPSEAWLSTAALAKLVSLR